MTDQPTKHEVAHAHAARKPDGSIDIAHMEGEAAKAFHNLKRNLSHVAFFTEQDATADSTGVSFSAPIKAGQKAYLLIVADGPSPASAAQEQTVADAESDKAAE